MDSPTLPNPGTRPSTPDASPLQSPEMSWRDNCAHFSLESIRKDVVTVNRTKVPFGKTSTPFYVEHQSAHFSLLQDGVYSLGKNDAVYLNY